MSSSTPLDRGTRLVHGDSNWNESARGVCFDFPNDVKIDFLVTFRCNAECAHCITSSNPHRTERLEEAEIVEVLTAGAANGKRYVSFTGGEPFLYYDMLRRVVRVAKGLGYFVASDTNAFWGGSARIASRMVRELREAGLDALFPSCDAYHLPWIPAESVQRVVAECEQQGLSCELNFLPSPDAAADARLIEMFQLERRGYFCDGLSLTGNDVTHLMPIFPTRAAGDIQDIGSMHLGVSPRGDCYGNVDISYTGEEFVGTPLFVGNLRREPAAGILARERDTPILKLARSTSPARVHAKLTAAGGAEEYAALFATRRFYSATEYWLALFAAPIWPRLRDVLEAWDPAASS